MMSIDARDLLQKVTGLNVSQAEARRAVEQRRRTLALDAAAYARLLAQRGEELQALTELVVVPESWMFRDPEAFNYLCGFVQRRLAAHPARLVRIASIPCAGGEEPYSIAMALRDAGVAPASWSIDAVDLSDVSIARARRGRYTRNAFRSHKLAFRDRYFTLVDGEYEIADELRTQVNFSQGNLVAPDFVQRPGHYDVIFCRNLLIYFDEATTAAAIANLSALLADDGVLLAGYAEVPSFCRNGFAAVRAPGAFALIKAAAATAQMAVPPVEARTPVAAPVRERRAVPVRPGAPAPQQARVPFGAPLVAPLVAPAPVSAATDQLAQARAMADKGDYNAAAQICRAVLLQAPDKAEAYFILGMVSECQQQSAQAAEQLRRCVYLQPDHYEALCHLALLVAQEGDSQQAAALRQRAARIYERMNAGAARKGQP